MKDRGFTEDRLIEIEKQLREYLGEEMKFDFRFVDHIPADRSGKLRYFVPEFDPDYIEPPKSGESDQ